MKKIIRLLLNLQTSSKLLLFLAISLLSSHALAQQKTFTVDPSTSEVAITLGAALHTVHGTFHVQSGEVQFDQSTSKMKGAILVAAGSGSSGDNGRDKKMDNEVLDAPHFTEISFAPHSYQGKIAPTGDSTVQVAGTFTLHGTPHELTVPMQIHMDGESCTVKATFAIPYVSWGLKDPSTFLLKVAKQVQVDLSLVGHLSAGS